MLLKIGKQYTVFGGVRTAAVISSDEGMGFSFWFLEFSHRSAALVKRKFLGESLLYRLG